MRLIDERNEEYGNAWYHAGVALGAVRERFNRLLETEPWVAHNWVLILSKLMRATASPRNKDHWRDIIGYAQLILDHLEYMDSPRTVTFTGVLKDAKWEFKQTPLDEMMNTGEEP